MGLGERQRLLRLDLRLGSPARTQIGLAEPHHPEGLVPQVLPRVGLRDGLLQQCHSLGSPAGEHIGCPRGSSNHREEEREVRPLHELQRLVEDPERLRQVALAQGEKTHAPRGHDPAIRVLGRLRDLDAFLRGGLSCSERPALGQRDTEVTAGEHRRQPRQPTVLLAQRAGERRHVLLEGRHRLPIVPQAAGHPSQVVLRHHSEAPLPQVAGQRQRALTRREGAVRVPHLRKMGEEIDRDPPLPVGVTQGLGQAFGFL